jgi:hypothetical protein
MVATTSRYPGKVLVDEPEAWTRGVVGHNDDALPGDPPKFFQTLGDIPPVMHRQYGHACRYTFIPKRKALGRRPYHRRGAGRALLDHRHGGLYSNNGSIRWLVGTGPGSDIHYGLRLA